jgi:hypothetical protein
MTDLITRLRTWSHARHAAPASDLMDEAADEIELLRADWPEQLQAHSVLIAEQELEIQRLRQVVSQKNLTAEEREAVAYYLGTGGPYAVYATLSGLLSRTGTNDAKTGDDAAECPSQGEKLPERELLTAAEREAVRYMIAAGKFGQRDEALTEEHAATLRGLLERLK